MDLRTATPEPDRTAVPPPAAPETAAAHRTTHRGDEVALHLGSALLAEAPAPTDAYLRRRERRRRGRALADAHAEAGIEAVLLSDRRGHRDPGRADDPEVTTRRAGGHRATAGVGGPVRVPVGRPRRPSLPVGAVLRHVVAHGRSATLHLHLESAEDLGAATAAATAHRGAVVVHVHGSPAHPRLTGDAATWRTRVVAGPLEGRLLARADLVVVGSETLAEQVSEGAARRVAVVPPAVLPAPVPLTRVTAVAPTGPHGTRPELRIVGVGPLTARRRPATLVRATARIVGAHLALVGTGPQRADLERLASELGVADRVEIVPTASWATVVDRLASADVAVSSALLPDDPDALLLAAAIGVPVVATRVGSTTAVLTDGVDARLLDPLDDEGLLAALTSVRDDPRASTRLAASARRRVTARGWRDVAREIDQHLRR